MKTFVSVSMATFSAEMDMMFDFVMFIFVRFFETPALCRESYLIQRSQRVEAEGMAYCCSFVNFFRR